MKKFLFTTFGLLGICSAALLYYRKKKKEDFINSLDEINRGLNMKQEYTTLSNSTVLLFDMNEVNGNNDHHLY